MSWFSHAFRLPSSVRKAPVGSVIGRKLTPVVSQVLHSIPLPGTQLAATAIDLARGQRPTLLGLAASTLPGTAGQLAQTAQGFVSNFSRPPSAAPDNMGMDDVMPPAVPAAFSATPASNLLGGIMPGRYAGSSNPFPLHLRHKRAVRVNPVTGAPIKTHRRIGLTPRNVRVALKVLKTVSKIYHKLPKARSSRPAGGFMSRKRYC